jgi:hypothetical protein
MVDFWIKSALNLEFAYLASTCSRIWSTVRSLPLVAATDILCPEESVGTMAVKITAAAHIKILMADLISHLPLSILPLFLSE